MNSGRMKAGGMSCVGDYRDKVTAQLQKDYGYRCPMAVPRLVKITLNMGLGDAAP